MGVTPPGPGGSLLRGGGSSKGGRDDCGQPHQKPGESALGTRLDWGGKKKDPFLPLPSPSPVVCFKAGRANIELVPAASRGFSLAWLLAFTKSFACQTNYATDKPRERLRKKAMQERNLCSQSRKLAQISL